MHCIKKKKKNIGGCDSNLQNVSSVLYRIKKEMEPSGSGNRGRPGSPVSVVGGASGESVSPRIAGPEIQGQPVNMQQMAEFFQNVARAAPRRSAIERLAKYRPTDFHGRRDEDASAAEYWFERTERILQQLHCTAEESLECAVSLLQEDAYQWWTYIAQIVRPRERT
ncbi:hypothetical protein ACOSP7_012078 [Xanthoceras sorbifolium]